VHVHRRKVDSVEQAKMMDGVRMLRAVCRVPGCPERTVYLPAGHDGWDFRERQFVMPQRKVLLPYQRFDPAEIRMR
jgi:hypothetical protein